MRLKFLKHIAFALTLFALLLIPVITFAGTDAVSPVENPLTSTFTVEGIVTTIVGFIVSILGTNWLKNTTGMQGGAATILAFVVSVLVAIVAVVASTFLSGQPFELQALTVKAASIFTLATLAYNTLMKDRAQTAEA